MSLTLEELTKHSVHKILFENCELKLVCDFCNRCDWYVGLREVFDLLNLEDDLDPPPARPMQPGEVRYIDDIGELDGVEYIPLSRLLDYCNCADDKGKGEALYNLVRDTINSLEEAWLKQVD